MKYVYALALAALVSSCTAYDHRKKHEDCRNNTFQISDKFFHTRIIASYQNSFPEFVIFPGKNSHPRDVIEDAGGNRFYTTLITRTVYGYIKCFKKRYLTLPYLNDATYATSIDKRMVFIAIKNGGPLFVFETDKPEVKGNKIILKTIDEVGNSVTSISVNQENGDIAIGRRHGNGGNVLLIEQIPKDPCETSTESPDARKVQIKNELKYTYKELMKSMGCEDVYLTKHKWSISDVCRKMKIFEVKMHDKVSELTTLYREKVEDQLNQRGESTTNKYLDDSNTNCEVENDKVITLEKAFDSQKNKTKNAQDMLDALIEGSDKIEGLGDVSEIDVSVKGNVIDQYSLRNYRCLLDKDWMVTEKNMLAVSEQAKFLMLGLKIVKNSFEEEELEVPPE